MTVAAGDNGRPDARVVVPLRLSPAGKALIQDRASAAGYTAYTAYMRDVLEAEALNPRHRPQPKGTP